MINGAGGWAGLWNTASSSAAAAKNHAGRIPGRAGNARAALLRPAGKRFTPAFTRRPPPGGKREVCSASKPDAGEQLHRSHGRFPLAALPPHSYGAAMRRFWPFPPRALVCWSLCGLLTGSAANLRAQPALPPEVQERLQRLEGLVEDLLAAQAALQKNLAVLRDEVQAVREESRRAGDRLGERFVSHEDLRKLAEALREVDRKREEDKRLILEEIKKLAQAPVPPPPRETARSAPREGTPASAGPQKGYTYKIKPGDTLSAIAQAYAQSGVKVTVDDILKANPGLKPNRLPVDREIFIPDPNLK